MSAVVPPPPPARERSNTTFVLVVAVVAVVIVAVIAYMNDRSGSHASCTVASTRAVLSIEAGERSPGGSSLSNEYAYGPVRATYVNGQTVDGYLLAAQTPAGVAVWVLDSGSIKGDAGSIAAVNQAAVTVANWSAALETTVSSSDVQAAIACLPTASS
jgi:hypothetical protein